MKISDERLSEIEYDALQDGESQYAPYTHTEVHFMAVELQQLREERSWRDINELNEASAPQYFQLRDKANVNPMPFWLMDGILCTWAEDVDGIGDVSIEMAQEWYTHFRPLPMDLPEVE